MSETQSSGLSAKQIVWLSAGGFTLLVMFVITMIGVSASNSEIRLKQQVLAQQKANEAVFDNMWKILQQQAQIADKYKTAFSQIYPDLISGRYKDSNLLFKFVQESNPTFDTKLYDRLSSSIEIQRNVFTDNQKKLIDLNREHTTMLQTFPASLFIGRRDTIAITIITSDRTDKTFSTGKDNDTNL